MRITLFATLFLFLAACGTADDDQELCERYFQPYPDLISGRQAMKAFHQPYQQAMVLYAQGEYSGAAEGLKEYLSKRGSEKTAHLYLAMCYLEMDRPFDAELHLDHLETSPIEGYQDQIQWYTLLCWVCSGQWDRALPEARRLASLPRHTYKQEAAQLAGALAREVDA